LGSPLFPLFRLRTFSHPEVVGEDQGTGQDTQAIEMNVLHPYAFGVLREEKGGGVHVANIGPPTELLKIPLSGLLNLQGDLFLRVIVEPKEPHTHFVVAHPEHLF